eukprot:scaffold5884_cov110-Isochrysis_galbana.AAC.6
MWCIRARCAGPSLLLDRGREWQAQGQLPAHGRAGRRLRAQSRAVRAGRARTWASGLATSSILRWSCCAPPGREAAAAPTAAAICQEPRRSALAAANRAAQAASARPSWDGKVGRAAPSSFRTQGALRGAMRARCPPGC